MYHYVELARFVNSNDQQIISSMCVKMPRAITQAQATSPPDEEMWEFLSKYKGWSPVSYWSQEGYEQRCKEVENVNK